MAHAGSQTIAKHLHIKPTSTLHSIHRCASSRFITLLALRTYHRLPFRRIKLSSAEKPFPPFRVHVTSRSSMRFSYSLWQIQFCCRLSFCTRIHARIWCVGLAGPTSFCTMYYISYPSLTLSMIAQSTSVGKCTHCHISRRTTDNKKSTKEYKNPVHINVDG